jgi:hypothetical protein
MRKKMLVLFVAGFVFTASCANPWTTTHAKDACPGAWSRLLPYAGTYLTDQFLAEADLARALDGLLGPELEHLRANISVTGSIDLVGCSLVVSGNADHMGGLEDGILAVNLSAGTVGAAIHTEDRFDIYVDSTDPYAVPISIRDWLAVVAVEYRYRFELPPNARQVPPRDGETR